MTFDLSLYEFLKKRVKPCNLTVRKDETTIRCPFCGDSVKSNKSTHLYIKNVPPFMYYCQRCTASGIFDSKILIKLNSYDPNMDIYLKNSYNGYMEKLNQKYGASFFSYINNEEPEILPNQYGELEMKKIEYINNRLGIDISQEDIKKYRIILNIEDYYTNNELTSSLDQRSIDMIKNLNQNYFSFLLNDKNVINCRSMVSDTKYKHFKLRIHEDTNSISRRFYSIKNDIDLSGETFNINITEGFFDIISVHENIKNKEMDNTTLYIANNGKGYLFTLDYLASIGILNANINIYSDKDVSPSDYKNNKLLGRSHLTKLNGANIYYNNYENEKDFGVPKERIIVSSPNITKFI